MTQKARILNRSSVEVIEIEQEQAKAEFQRNQQKELAGLTAEKIAEIEAIEPEERSEAENESLAFWEHVEADYQTRIQQLAEYLPFEPSDPPETSDTDNPLPYYEERSGVVIRAWEIQANEPARIAAKIESLKVELAGTDYQVVKAYEYTMAGIPCEYDPLTLYKQRQAIRNQIDTLKTLLP